MLNMIMRFWPLTDILSAGYDESDIQNQQNSSGHIQNSQTDTQDSQTDTQDSQTDTQDSQTDSRNSQANVQISADEASKLALERVPGASAQDLKIELDYDDGRYKYEGDIIYDMKEYEFEIDADTGEFLEWKEERR